MRLSKAAIFFPLLFFLITSVIYAEDVKTLSQYDQKVQEIHELEKKLSDINGQEKTLSSQITVFDNQVKLAQLKIDQTNFQINSLTGKIGNLEGAIGNLSQVYQERAGEMYRLSRVGDPMLFLLSSQDFSVLLTRVRYLRKIAQYDRDLLIRLQTSQTTLQVQKQQLDVLQKQLQQQTELLNRQKQSKQKLLELTKNDEKKYQQLLSQAKAQLEAFRKFVSSQGGASILSNQTKCDSWGCYYNQRDSLWGNMPIGLSSTSMADAGCLVSSVAMVATHYGKNLKPSDIAGSSAAFFSNTAYLNQTWGDLGMSVVRTPTSVSADKIDAEINAGRPVIVGVYGSFNEPEHFIVLKGKNDKGYIMNDPFLENGGDRPFSDKYTFSDIVRIDLIKIN